MDGSITRSANRKARQRDDPRFGLTRERSIQSWDVTYNMYCVIIRVNDVADGRYIHIRMKRRVGAFDPSFAHSKLCMTEVTAHVFNVEAPAYDQHRMKVSEWVKGISWA